MSSQKDSRLIFHKSLRIVECVPQTPLVEVAHEEKKKHIVLPPLQNGEVAQTGQKESKKGAKKVF